MKCVICDKDEKDVSKLLKYPWGIAHEKCWEGIDLRDKEEIFDGLLEESKKFADRAFPPDSDARRNAYIVLEDNVRKWREIERGRT